MSEKHHEHESEKHHEHESENHHEHESEKHHKDAEEKKNNDSTELKSEIKEVKKVGSSLKKEEVIVDSIVKEKNFWLVFSIVVLVALFVSVLTRGFTTFGAPVVQQSSVPSVNPTNGSTTTAPSGSSALTVYIVDNMNCPYCNVTSLVDIAKQVFANATINLYNYNSTQGQSFIKLTNTNSVPLMLFGKTQLEKSPIWSRLRHDAFESAGDYYYLTALSLGSNPYYLDPTIRAKFEAQLAAQKKAAAAFKAKATAGKPRVDLFVMAYCPYGNQAENALAPVYDALKDNATFVPHYIVSGSSGGFKSLHGTQEVHEDIREICVYHMYGQKGWFNFVIAMNDKSTVQNSDSTWKQIATNVGLNVTAIQNCYDQNGTRYLEQEENLTDALSVTGSPTIYFGGVLYSGQRTSESYLNSLCTLYPAGQAPASCKETMNSTYVPASGSCN